MPLSLSRYILILEKSDKPIFKSKPQEESQCIATRKIIRSIRTFLTRSFSMNLQTQIIPARRNGTQFFRRGLHLCCAAVC